jgi:choline dehydrogenase-like flavoprotein
VILASGALETPRILLTSTSRDWPRGVANDTGLVGKNLMRHFVDLFAVQPRTKGGHPGNRKELAFNDYYLADGRKLGTVQSFGALPPVPVVIAELEHELAQGAGRWSLPLFRLGKPFLKHVLHNMLERRLMFASILEDVAYEDNMVSLDAGRVKISYRIRDYDRQRICVLRDAAKSAFQPHRLTMLKQAENNQRIAHACGTCRFGLDPKSSVLNAQNRSHRIENLYIVDGSFFASSGGTNPALTIAANALRVADCLGGPESRAQESLVTRREGR